MSCVIDINKGILEIMEISLSFLISGHFYIKQLSTYSQKFQIISFILLQASADNIHSVNQGTPGTSL